ncbi:hypothetical protein [Parasphingorhabdus sp.]|uniref:hypothetical protein n=1 Tax=Parasphingorhabdus sp. TaxID=2709688 RepID=UPI0032F083C4
METRTRLIETSTLAMSLCVPSVAFAQENSDNDDNVIVVTALKRSENLQDIPAAISAIGGEEHTARGMHRFAGEKQ